MQHVWSAFPQSLSSHFFCLIMQSTFRAGFEIADTARETHDKEFVSSRRMDNVVVV